MKKREPKSGSLYHFNLNETGSVTPSSFLVICFVNFGADA